MSHRTLIQSTELDALLRGQRGQSIVFDCSFDLANPAAGRAAHAAGHVPGAVYLHLDDDLSGPKTGRNGRHPLPTRAAFAERLAQLGVDGDSQVVVYDASGGMVAARAWWMLRWVGHAEVALLDGGLGAWQGAGLPLETTPPAPRRRGSLVLRPALVATAERAALLGNLEQPQLLLLDARSADRFRGENETLDPVAGHIPGARNRFFRDNLGPDGRFKSAAQLRAEFAGAVGGRTAAQVVMCCGSGVTACHNLLAMELAGAPGAMLYPGSWSEWCAWPDSPLATGPA